MSLAYYDLIKFYPSDFEKKVIDIAGKLEINPDWLMIVFYAESRVNHQAVNSLSGATGLIQFLPSTALSLGTTTAQLKAMTNIKQLDYVYKYLLPYKGKMKTAYDVYMAVFSPKFIAKSRDYVAYSNPAKAYTQNKALDLNKDNKITVGEIQDWFNKYIPFSVPTGKNNYTNYALAGLLFLVIIKK
jgi:hypothetical protein